MRVVRASTKGEPGFLGVTLLFSFFILHVPVIQIWKTFFCKQQRDITKFCKLASESITVNFLSFSQVLNLSTQQGITSHIQLADFNVGRTFSISLRKYGNSL